MSSEAIAAAIPKALLTQVCATFHDAQHHSSSHRKNVHTLIKLHGDCAKQGGEGERAFFLSFLHSLHHILSVRKNDELSNKMMRFVCGFIVRLAQQHGGDEAAGRFIENAMLYSLDNVDAKDKYVRARLTQIVVAGVTAVEEVSDAVWQLLQVKMIERLYDKEAMVRVHAVHALSRLQSLLVTVTVAEDASDGGGRASTTSASTTKSVHELLINILLKDPSSEVRKAALVQIDIYPNTVEFVLTRARDVDPSIRKSFFAQKMKQIDIHLLSLEQRDYVLKSGLTDREEVVQRACVEMIFGLWLPRTNSNLVQFLTSLDVVSNRPVAASALHAFFTTIPDLFTSFPDSYFDHLTVETAFILACYCEHVKEAPRVQEMLPELSKVAGCISKFYQYLVAVDGDDAAKAEVEFILSELMAVCQWMDGGDEVGRRLVQSVLEEIMLNMNISDGLFKKCCRLLRQFTPDLQAYVELMLSLSADFESVSVDTNMTDEHVKIMAQLRSVSLVAILLNTDDQVTITRFPVLLSVLNNLVIPAINSPYAVVQATGLDCLGLYTLISTELSMEYHQLFVDFLKVNNGETRNVALRCLFDVSLVHRAATGDALAVLVPMLCDGEQEVQSTAVEGFAKLLLHNRLEDALAREVLLGLLTLFYHPLTAKTSGRLCQCLSYFFHAYAFSSAARQQRLRSLVSACMLGLADIVPNVNTLFTQLMYFVDPSHVNEECSSSGGVDWSELLLGLLLAALGLHKQQDHQKCAKFLTAATKLPLLPTAANTQTIKECAYLCNLLLRHTAPSSQPACRKLCTLLAMADVEVEALEKSRLAGLQARIAAVCPELLSMPCGAGPGGVVGVGRPRVKKAVRVENVMDNLQDILE